ncbi:cytochrome P450/oxidoreductase [Acidimangrovimonas sediminis]|uniref:cytochrome P450/oxidoreductase n=1 Tax=Acidimangrovimonas sediminis TaxID=2056283 RepID=UPI000C809DB6|nr:cytochrome P450/oxidoreductase [Acidimangrovimonas sediminis]
MTETAAPACPFHQAGSAQNHHAQDDLDARARHFDAFGAPYQADPAEALRWSREERPVFYSEEMGYWIVTRYDDIKAVFRDNILFSPRNVLEKITPATPEAVEILKSYDYAMDRTMVNEDEPAHMIRRRALMDHFLPENLEKNKEMIRQLTSERIDAFIASGRTDLVAAMLYEVPLLVALHFLGVPEDEIATLRTFSVAHSVNTWGKPSPDKQAEVAHDVGRFWQYAGRVIEKMRAETDGTGWMHYTIRKNAEIPEVVTDSYVHSMMMAIIVAAHETTSLASANMFRLLLSNRPAWEEICNDPGLIPNAVEECLRYGGSIVAWRRQTTAPAVVGGVEIPEGAKLLIVQTSGNRDPLHFENADDFDIYRSDAVDHLSFGYGAHQCMGKNIARMEMRIFLEEMTRRIPGLRLAEQAFSYVPSTSFRGPEALWVEWDPAQVPERAGNAAPHPVRDFAVGAPSARDIARRVRVAEVRQEAEGVLGVTLEDPQGRPLPAWTAGAHVELCDGTVERKYSLCGRPGAGYSVAILREETGKGGSRHFHERLRPGTELRLRGPGNHFRLDETRPHTMLVAGGIGITPILAMADRLKILGRSYEIHYAGRSRGRMAFLDRLAADHGDRLTLHVGDEGTRADLAAIVASLPEGGQIFACGPARMLSALDDLTADHPEGTYRFEHFQAASALLDPGAEHGFTLDLADSGLTVTVAPDETVLDALAAAGVDVACDCREGLCGSCEVAVLEGEIDHRDAVLTRSERAGMTRMMTCCSRARGAKLKLAL